MTSRCSGAGRSAHPRPSGVGRCPEANSAISSATGRAWARAGSYQLLKICRKIHWVQR